MRTTMKSTTLWEENKMKILEDYKKIAQELLFEVDDEKMIKYKDEDGESAEMKAGSAKTMPDDHPAKQAYNKMKDGGDDKEEPSGQKLGGGDFERDGGTDSDDKDSDSGDEEFTIDQQIADIEKDIAFADKQDSPYWDKEGARLRNVLKNMQKENYICEFNIGLPLKPPWGELGSP